MYFPFLYFSNALLHSINLDSRIYLVTRVYCSPFFPFYSVVTVATCVRYKRVLRHKPPRILRSLYRIYMRKRFLKENFIFSSVAKVWKSGFSRYTYCALFLEPTVVLTQRMCFMTFFASPTNVMVFKNEESKALTSVSDAARESSTLANNSRFYMSDL